MTLVPNVFGFIIFVLYVGHGDGEEVVCEFQNVHVQMNSSTLHIYSHNYPAALSRYEQLGILGGCSLIIHVLCETTLF